MHVDNQISQSHVEYNTPRRRYRQGRENTRYQVALLIGSKQVAQKA